ncbi:unnamed protein product, partial [Scytosiphon promiscuus]
ATPETQCWPLSGESEKQFTQQAALRCFQVCAGKKALKPGGGGERQDHTTDVESHGDISGAMAARWSGTPQSARKRPAAAETAAAPTAATSA